MAKHDREFQVKDLVTPIWKAILAVAIYALIVFLLFLLNIVIDSTLLSDTVSVLFRFLAVVFLLSVIVSYANHFRKIKSVAILVPGLDALSSVTILYFITSLFSNLNRHLAIALLDTICNMILSNLLVIFLIVLVVDYLFWLVRRT